jgi:hypothetical protein
MSIALITAPALADKIATGLRSRDAAVMRLLRPLLWHFFTALDALQAPLGQPCYRTTDCPASFFASAHQCRWSTAAAVTMKPSQTAPTVLELIDAQVCNVSEFSSSPDISFLIHPLATWSVVSADASTVVLKQLP